MQTPIALYLIFMEIHKTIELNVNGTLVDIDEGIVALVSWFNRSGAKTLYSCQGDKKCTEIGGLFPYVCFSCSEEFFTKLIKIVEDYVSKNTKQKIDISKYWEWEDGKLNIKHSIGFGEKMSKVNLQRLF